MNKPSLKLLAICLVLCITSTYARKINKVSIDPTEYNAIIRRNLTHTFRNSYINQAIKTTQIDDVQVTTPSTENDVPTTTELYNSFSRANNNQEDDEYSTEGEETTETLPELEDLTMLEMHAPEPASGNDLPDNEESVELYDRWGNPVPINYITPITINSPYPYVQTHVHIPAPEQILYDYVHKSRRPTRNPHRSYRPRYYHEGRSQNRPIDWDHINGLIQNAQGLQRSRGENILSFQTQNVRRTNTDRDNVRIIHTIPSTDVDEIVIDKSNDEVILTSVERFQEEPQPPEIIITKVVSGESSIQHSNSITKEHISEILDGIKVTYPGNGERIKIGCSSSEIVDTYYPDENLVKLNIHGRVNNGNFIQDVSSVEIIKTNSELRGNLDIEVSGNVGSQSRGSCSSESSNERGRVNLHIRGGLHKASGEEVNIDQTKRVDLNYDHNRKDIREKDRVVVSKSDCGKSRERITVNKNAHVRLTDDNLEISSKENVHQNYRNSRERLNSHEYIRENIKENFESGEQSIRKHEHEHLNYRNKIGDTRENVHEHKHNDFNLRVNQHGDEKLRTHEHEYLNVNNRNRDEHNHFHYHNTNNLNLNNRDEIYSKPCSGEVIIQNNPKIHATEHEHVHQHYHNKHTKEHLSVGEHQHAHLHENNNRERLHYHDNEYFNYRDRANRLNIHEHETLNQERQDGVRTNLDYKIHEHIDENHARTHNHQRIHVNPDQEVQVRNIGNIQGVRINERFTDNSGFYTQRFPQYYQARRGGNIQNHYYRHGLNTVSNNIHSSRLGLGSREVIAEQELLQAEQPEVILVEKPNRHGYVESSESKLYKYDVPTVLVSKPEIVHQSQEVLVQNSGEGSVVLAEQEQNANLGGSSKLNQNQEIYVYSRNGENINANQQQDVFIPEKQFYYYPRSYANAYPIFPPHYQPFPQSIEVSQQQSLQETLPSIETTQLTENNYLVVEEPISFEDTSVIELIEPSTVSIVDKRNSDEHHGTSVEHVVDLHSSMESSQPHVIVIKGDDDAIVNTHSVSEINDGNTVSAHSKSFVTLNLRNPQLGQTEAPCLDVVEETRPKPQEIIIDSSIEQPEFRNQFVDTQVHSTGHHNQHGYDQQVDIDQLAFQSVKDGKQKMIQFADQHVDSSEHEHKHGSSEHVDVDQQAFQSYTNGKERLDQQLDSQVEVSRRIKPHGSDEKIDIDQHGYQIYKNGNQRLNQQLDSNVEASRVIRPHSSNEHIDIDQQANQSYRNGNQRLNQQLDSEIEASRRLSPHGSVENVDIDQHGYQIYKNGNQRLNQQLDSDIEASRVIRPHSLNEKIDIDQQGYQSYRNGNQRLNQQLDSEIEASRRLSPHGSVEHVDIDQQAYQSYKNGNQRLNQQLDSNIEASRVIRPHSSNEQIDIDQQAYQSYRNGNQRLNQQLDSEIEASRRLSPHGSVERVDTDQQAYQSYKNGNQRLNQQLDSNIEASRVIRPHSSNEQVDIDQQAYQSYRNGNQRLNQQLDSDIEASRRLSPHGSVENVDIDQHGYQSYKNGNQRLNQQLDSDIEASRVIRPHSLNEKIDIDQQGYQSYRNGNQRLNQQLDSEIEASRRISPHGSVEHVDIDQQAYQSYKNGNQRLNQQFDSNIEASRVIRPHSSNEQIDIDQQAYQSYRNGNQRLNQQLDSEIEASRRLSPHGSVEHVDIDQQAYQSYKNGNQRLNQQLDSNIEASRVIRPHSSNEQVDIDQQAYQSYRNGNQRLNQQLDSEIEASRRLSPHGSVEHVDIDHQAYQSYKNGNQRLNQFVDSDVEATKKINPHGSFEKVDIDQQGYQNYRNGNERLNQQIDSQIDASQRVDSHGSVEKLNVDQQAHQSYSNGNERVDQNIDSQISSREYDKVNGESLKKIHADVEADQTIVKGDSVIHQKVDQDIDSRERVDSEGNVLTKERIRTKVTDDNGRSKVYHQVLTSREDVDDNTYTYSDGHHEITERVDDDDNIQHIHISSVEVDESGEAYTRTIDADVRLVDDAAEQLTILENIKTSLTSSDGNIHANENFGTVVINSNEEMEIPHQREIPYPIVYVQNTNHFQEEDRNKIIFQSSKPNNKLEQIPIGCDSVEVMSNVPFTPIEQRKIQSFLADCGSDEGLLKPSSLPHSFNSGETNAIISNVLNTEQSACENSRPLTKINNFYTTYINSIPNRKQKNKQSSKFVTLKTGTVNEYFQEANERQQSNVLQLQEIIPREDVPVIIPERPTLLNLPKLVRNDDEVTLLSSVEILPKREFDVETLHPKQRNKVPAPQIVSINPENQERLGYDKYIPDTEAPRVQRPMKIIDNERERQRRVKHRQRQGFLPFRDGRVHGLNGSTLRQPNLSEFVTNNEFKNALKQSNVVSVQNVKQGSKEGCGSPSAVDTLISDNIKVINGFTR